MPPCFRWSNRLSPAKEVLPMFQALAQACTAGLLMTGVGQYKLGCRLQAMGLHCFTCWHSLPRFKLANFLQGMDCLQQNQSDCKIKEQSFSVLGHVRPKTFWCQWFYLQFVHHVSNATHTFPNNCCALGDALGFLYFHSTLSGIEGYKDDFRQWVTLILVDRTHWSLAWAMPWGT